MMNNFFFVVGLCSFVQTPSNYNVTTPTPFVFQEKLQNSFRQATSKISATIGLGLPRDQSGEAPGQEQTNIDDVAAIDEDAVDENDDC